MPGIGEVAVQRGRIASDISSALPIATDSVPKPIKLIPLVGVPTHGNPSGGECGDLKQAHGLLPRSRHSY